MLKLFLKALTVFDCPEKNVPQLNIDCEFSDTRVIILQNEEETFFFNMFHNFTKLLCNKT